MYRSASDAFARAKAELGLQNWPDSTNSRGWPNFSRGCTTPGNTSCCHLGLASAAFQHSDAVI
jgi:hypothetical protein